MRSQRSHRLNHLNGPPRCRIDAIILTANHWPWEVRLDIDGFPGATFGQECGIYPAS